MLRCLQSTCRAHHQGIRRRTATDGRRDFELLGPPRLNAWASVIVLLVQRFGKDVFAVRWISGCWGLRSGVSAATRTRSGNALRRSLPGAVALLVENHLRTQEHVPKASESPPPVHRILRCQLTWAAVTRASPGNSLARRRLTGRCNFWLAKPASVDTPSRLSRNRQSASVKSTETIWRMPVCAFGRTLRTQTTIFTGFCIGRCDRSIEGEKHDFGCREHW